jgi:hypothetical protein
MSVLSKNAIEKIKDKLSIADNLTYELRNINQLTSKLEKVSPLLLKQYINVLIIFLSLYKITNYATLLSAYKSIESYEAPDLQRKNINRIYEYM